MFWCHDQDDFFFLENKKKKLSYLVKADKIESPGSYGMCSTNFISNLTSIVELKNALDLRSAGSSVINVLINYLHVNC